MKKYNNKFVALLLSFVMTFSAMISIVVYADDVEARPSCLVDHFSNLTKSHSNGYKNRIPINTLGTCTHVAMSMLLSYYDSYWNDSFVAEGIEWDKGVYNFSTDVLSETFTASTEAAAWYAWKNTGGDFRGFAAENENTYLHPYMFEFANSEVITDNLGIVGLLDIQVKNVLEAYLYDVCGFTENEVTVNIQYATIDGDDAIIDTMKEQILSGNPVIFFGLNVDILPAQLDNDTMAMSGHAMIGYDIDVDAEGNDDIILHTGWSGNEYVKVSTTDYQYLNSIVWIEINEENLPHDCSDNYYDPTTGETFCACEIYYNTHPAHDEHHHSINGNPGFDSVYHWTNACRCGGIGPNSVVNSHSLSYTYIESLNYHYEECSGCGYYNNVGHTYNQYATVSNTHHAGACACGAISSDEEAHVESFCVSQGSDIHYVYCKCGYKITEDYHEMVPINIRYSKCRRCGYIRDNNNPGFIIKGVEDEYDTCKE